MKITIRKNDLRGFLRYLYRLEKIVESEGYDLLYTKRSDNAIATLQDALKRG